MTRFSRFAAIVFIDAFDDIGAASATDYPVRSVKWIVSYPPGAYTMLFADPANCIDASLYDKLPFNFIRDIAPVAGLIRTPYVPRVNSSRKLFGQST